MAKKSKKRTSRKSSGLFGLGLGEVTKTFSPNKLMEIAKTGGMMLLGYIGANATGKFVAKMVNKDEQNPQGVKKYVDALTQGAVACICVSMSGKRTWLRHASYGASLSAVQTTIETISGKSVLEMFKIGNGTKATNGMGAIAGSEELILPELTGADDEEIEGIEDDEISGADDDYYDDGISGEIFE